MMLKCRLCLLQEKEVIAFLKERANVEIKPSFGSLELIFHGEEAEKALSQIKERFPTFFIGDQTLEEAILKAFVEKKMKLGVAESCSGGMLSQKIISVPGASTFFQGGIIAYSNDWKERFLHVRRDTLKKNKAASAQVASEMVEGLLENSDVDYAVAITGELGQKDSFAFIGIGKKGDKIDIGRLDTPSDRLSGMDYISQMALAALWRRVVHNEWTFS